MIAWKAERVVVVPMTKNGRHFFAEKIELNHQFVHRGTPALVTR